jgi:hypothetical protein
MIPGELALRIAREEKDGYETALTGIYGREIQAQAIREGLVGIVYSTYEAKGIMHFQDLITGESWAEKVPQRAKRGRR